jgi:phosphoinositide-3-kinase regulatory subunit 4
MKLTEGNDIIPSNPSVVPEYIILNMCYLLQDPEVLLWIMYTQCIAPSWRPLSRDGASSTHIVSPGIDGDRPEYKEMHFEASHTYSFYFASYLSLVDRYRTTS